MATPDPPSLFDPPEPEPEPSLGNQLGPFRRDHPETSRQAALDNYPKSGTQRARVLLAIAASETGLTDHEVVERVGISPSSARPRRVELWKDALVVESGQERATDTGSMAQVWIVTDLGRTVVAELRNPPSPS